jgi:hypothetical protein
MQNEKVTLALSKSALAAIDKYMRAHSLKRREQVVEIALALLREHEREEDYEEALEDDADERYDLEIGASQGHSRDDDRW